MGFLAVSQPRLFAWKSTTATGQNAEARAGSDGNKIAPIHIKLSFWACFDSHAALTDKQFKFLSGIFVCVS